jgi:hypothetical protein
MVVISVTGLLIFMGSSASDRSLFGNQQYYVAYLFTPFTLSLWQTACRQHGLGQHNV